MFSFSFSILKKVQLHPWVFCSKKILTWTFQKDTIRASQHQTFCVRGYRLFDRNQLFSYFQNQNVRLCRKICTHLIQCSTSYQLNWRHQIYLIRNVKTSESGHEIAMLQTITFKTLCRNSTQPCKYRQIQQEDLVKLSTFTYFS